MSRNGVYSEAYRDIPTPIGSPQERQNSWFSGKPITWQLPTAIGKLIVPESALTVLRRDLVRVPYGLVGTAWEPDLLGATERAQRDQNNTLLSRAGLEIIDECTDEVRQSVIADARAIGVIAPEQVDMQVRGGNYVRTPGSPSHDLNVHMDGSVPQLRYGNTPLGDSTLFVPGSLSREDAVDFDFPDKKATQSYESGELVRFYERTAHKAAEPMPADAFNPRLFITASSYYKF